MINKKLFLIFLIKIISSLNVVAADEIVGCGGFIKSHTDIDFSKVEIKLLTKQGSIKDKTDCSPSNGYYFIPVYDKGEYILKISPPPGWSFEPESVEFNFNGKTDICSQGKDINFVFKGFGITGKVVIVNGGGGAKDIIVELRSEDGKDIRKTTTDIHGIFSFSPIIPGRYTVKASHPSWYLSKSEYSVDVKIGNTELPENSLVVGGFDVRGKIGGNGQQFNTVGFALFREKGANSLINCEKIDAPQITSENNKYENNPVCFTKTSDKSGEFIFKAVVPGKYLVKPVVLGAGIKLHIKPEHLEFEIIKDSVELKDSFEITGFSIKGKVLNKPKGKGLPGALVKMNGQDVTTTGNDGVFVLENIQSGTYNLEVFADNLQFTPQNIKLSSTNPDLPDIVASNFKVCGQVLSDKSYAVKITEIGTNSHSMTTSSEDTGDWCIYLTNGKYAMEVVTTETDKANGIQFFPLKQNVEVNYSPISGVIFSQLRATLKGEVKCLQDSSDNCKGIEVTLNSLDANGKPTDQKTTIKAQDGKYVFSDVLPGPYELTIPNLNLCWEKTSFNININSAEETAPTFIHRGYEIVVISSHRATMQYTLRNAQKAGPALSHIIQLISGTNTFCTTRAGEYSIELQGCHIFDYKSTSTISTRDNTPLVVTAVAHKIGIRVLSTEQNLPLKLAIDSKTGKQIVSLISESHKVDSYYAFRYDTYLKPNEVITVTPQSNIMLFKPETKEIIGGNDCIDIVFNFIATKGLIIQGKTYPPIKDAKITLSFPQNPELSPLKTFSSSSGDFKFGPIDGSLEFDLKAEKESYIFSSFDRVRNLFEAHKLCDIIVSVKDEKGAQLSGVLLSLSGAESYRKNLVTGDDGKIKFHSLSPSQYFLRPMMKEYKFDPNSKMIDVKDGATVNVELIGYRVAYSIFGTVASLNGSPFANVIIEAISNEKCLHHQEESSSENNGQYRIRGLLPECTYTVRLRDTQENSSVQRSIPEERSIEIGHDDVRDINLIAISPVDFVDVIARVRAPTNEHYKTLRIQMYRKGNADSPVYSQRMESPLIPRSPYNPGVMVFFPRIPLDRKTYFVELKTSMPDKFYKLILPVVQFVANTSSIYVELEFRIELKTSESDYSQNSLSALILVCLVAIALFKHDLAVDFLNFVWNKSTTIIQDLMQKRQKKRDNRTPEVINYKEIEQIAEGINSIKKKKAKKI